MVAANKEAIETMVMEYLCHK